MKATEALAIKQIADLEEQLKIANIRLQGFSRLLEHINQMKEAHDRDAKSHALDAICGEPEKKVENEELTKESNAKATLCESLLEFARRQ